MQFESLHSVFIWNRSHIFFGQWWRILTGHFIHSNYFHLGMNLLGLLVIHRLFKEEFSSLFVSSLFVLVFLMSIAIGICLIFFTSMTTYFGLSGLLHGLFGYFSLKKTFRNCLEGLFLVSFSVIKGILEYIYGASELISRIIGAHIAVEAHLLGLSLGLIFSSIEFFAKNKHLSISKEKE
ncbi:rhombosortase [Candidatus Photodesmus anomalopis]|nr:rhombosortase [Candidatus Photodesmus katoptron]